MCSSHFSTFLSFATPWYKFFLHNYPSDLLSWAPCHHHWLHLHRCIHLFFIFPSPLLDRLDLCMCLVCLLGTMEVATSKAATVWLLLFQFQFFSLLVSTSAINSTLQKPHHDILSCTVAISNQLIYFFSEKLALIHSQHTHDSHVSI